MKTYELTFIISPGLGSEQANGLTKEVESFIQANEGIIVKSQVTPPQVLSYTIKKQHSGYFVVLEIQLGEEKVKTLKERLEKDTQILRHLILIKKPYKEVKERRMRRTFVSPIGSMEQGISNEGKLNQPTPSPDHNKGKVDLAEVEKKLDEILSE